MATYYIGTLGSDANAGTLDNPFASVAAANKVVAPGDTVYFLGGTYHNSTFNDGNIWKAGLDIALRIDGVHGTAEAPITYAAAPGAHVTIAYDGNGAIRISNSSYVNIQGLDIQGPSQQITMAEAIEYQFAYRLPNDDTTYHRDPAATLTASVASLGGVKPNYYESNAVMIGNNANHIGIINNVIHDSPGYGISSQGGADYITITGNTLYNNSWWSSGTHGISIQNVVSSDTFEGVKILIQGNTLYDNYNRLVSWALPKTAPVSIVNDEGKGIQLQNSTAATGFTHGQILVDNNLVMRSGNAGISENIVERITISNNTLIDNGYVNVLQSLGLGDPMLPAGYRVSDGGIRLQGGTDITIKNNVISQAEGLNALEGSTGLVATDANVSNNIFNGGNATNASADKFGAGMVFEPLPIVAGTPTNDTLFGGPDESYLHGGGGRDTAYYYSSTAGVNINLMSGVGAGGDAAGDKFNSIENIIGSNTGDDVLTGDGNINFLSGFGGNDQLVGGDGADSLSGGEGNDDLTTGTGFDYANGGAGIDTLHFETSSLGVGVHLTFGAGYRGDALGDGFAGIENVKGSGFADVMYGEASANTLEGFAGVDEFHGSAGADTHDGGTENDTSYYRSSVAGVTVTLANSGASVAGLGGDAAGDIQISIENIIGSQTGGDTLTGNNASNFFNGNGGADRLNGLGGNDSLFGGFDVGVVDTFVFSGSGFGFDTIGDFVDGTDKIELNQVPGVLNFANLSITQVNPSLVFVGVNGDPASGITVQGNGGVVLTASDFIFT
jgi:Ca2+-binding RTX toxin-like protein